MNQRLKVSVVLCLCFVMANANLIDMMFGTLKKSTPTVTKETSAETAKETTKEVEHKIAKRQIPFGLGLDTSFMDYAAYDYYDWVCSGGACQLCDVLTGACCVPTQNNNCFLPDSCANNPCLSGGTCVTTRTIDNQPDFTCVCQRGLTGKYCQLIDEFTPPIMAAMPIGGGILPGGGMPPPPPPAGGAAPAPAPAPQQSYGGYGAQQGYGGYGQQAQGAAPVQQAAAPVQGGSSMMGMSSFANGMGGMGAMGGLGAGMGGLGGGLGGMGGMGGMGGLGSMGMGGLGGMAGMGGMGGMNGLSGMGMGGLGSGMAGFGNGMGMGMGTGLGAQSTGFGGKRK